MGRTVLAEIGETVIRAVRLILFRPVKADEPGPGLPALGLLVGLLLSVNASFSALEAAENLTFNEWGIITVLSSLAVFTAMLAVTSHCFPIVVLRRAVADWLAINTLYIVALIGLFAGYENIAGLMASAQPLAGYAYRALGLLLLALTLTAITRAGRHLWDKTVRWAGARMLAAFVVPILLIPSQPIVVGEDTSWATADAWYWSRQAMISFAEDTEQSAGAAYISPWTNVEDTLYRQPALLTGMLGGMFPAQSSRPQYFFLAAAPSAAQDVFASEVTKAKAIFDDRFGTRLHSAVLINSLETLDTVPLANSKNLAVALREIGHLMNRERDVLVLYITSHGAEGVVSVFLPGYPLNQITPDSLANALDAARIKNRVLIISACHSGSFIPRLEGPDTLIMTAARADRTSFGCANGRDWTYFGDALFNNALREENDLIKAFHKANALIGQWEVWRRLLMQKPSEPQVSIGRDITKTLAAMAGTVGDQRADVEFKPPFQ